MHCRVRAGWGMGAAPGTGAEGAVVRQEPVEPLLVRRLPPPAAAPRECDIALRSAQSRGVSRRSCNARYRAASRKRGSAELQPPALTRAVFLMPGKH